MNEKLNSTAQKVLGDIKIVCGRTIAKVWRKNVNEKTKEVKIEAIHQGIIMQQTDSFVRVFNNAPLEKGGDVNAESAEWFPLMGTRSWIEIVGERSRDLPIPATLC